MAKLPKKIRIGAVDYTVKISSDPEEWDNDYDDTYGETQVLTAKILLSDKLSKAQRKTVLMHEVHHAAWSQTPLEVMSSYTEEEVIRAMEPLLTDTLQRNKKLREYVFS